MIGTECEIHNRAKDVGSATANWFKELLSSNPWFAKVVPNVSFKDSQHLSYQDTNS
jgi:D-amino-acid oxidase